MANRINNRRYNKLLSYRNNYYALGGPEVTLDMIGGNLLSSIAAPNLSTNLGIGHIDVPSQKQLNNIVENFKSGALNGLMSAAGTMAGSAISGGLSSTAGDTINSLSGLASAIPGPWGAISSAGLNVVGGLANRAFGTKLNKENIANVEGTINRLNNFQSDANSFDTLADTWGTTALGTDFSNRYIGKDGWFSTKAKRTANNLRKQTNLANSYVLNALQNNANNITETTMNTLQSNYAALGGFLNQYSDGGSIYIKPENRGKFNATKKRTGKTTEELTHSKNPLTRKRAIFAQNAAKWKHAFGGELNTNGGDFSTGLMFIDEGGTHESNPYEGIPMGVAPDGKPNLVEEGEVIYNDYVYSNRLTVPKAMRNKYKLRGAKDLTFADAVKQLTKGATERPNDPISQETLGEIMADLAQTQEGVREEAHKGNRFDTGGNMWTPTKINTYKGVPDYYGYDKPFWMNNDGTYTDKYNSFINNNYTKDMFRQHIKNQFDFYDNATEEQRKSNRYKAIQNFIDNNRDWYNNRANIANWNISDALYNQGKTLALSNPGFMHPEEIAQNALAKRANRYFLRGKDAQGNFTVTPMEVTPWEDRNDLGRTFAETYPQYKEVGKQERPIKNGTIYTDYYYDENKPAESTTTEDTRPPIDLGRGNESLRYIPAVGLGLASLTDALGLTNKPDYSEAAQIEAATRGSSYKPVSWSPIGNKLAYRPFDRDYYINKLNAEAGATRRALANQSGGNSGRAMAGILAADYNTQDRLGDLFRKSEEYNLEQRQKVEDFNRATNQLNAQGMLQADMANQQAAANARDYNLRGILASAEMRNKARLASEAARSANLSGFLQSLGDIGYENKAMNMIRRLAEAGYVPLSEPMQNIYATPSARRKLTSNKKKK